MASVEVKSAEDFDNDIRQDFIFILDLCMDIKEVFPQNSQEYTLAKQWMNFLCTYHANTIGESRLKNIYLSHLCAALYQNQLYGPFLKLPPKGQLEKVDFNVKQPALGQTVYGAPLCESTPVGSADCVSDQRTINTSGFVEEPPNVSAESPNNLTRGKLPGACDCPPQPCNCGATGMCQCSRRTGGSEFMPNGSTIHLCSSACKTTNDYHHHNHNKDDFVCNYLMQELNFSPDFLLEFDATLSSFMNLCNLKCIEGRTGLLSNKATHSKQSPITSQTAAVAAATAAVMSTANCQHNNQYCPSQQLQQQEQQQRHYHQHHSGDNLVQCTGSSPTQISDATTPSAAPVEGATLTEPTTTVNVDQQLNIKELLQAISAELRGETEPGTNDVLEHELCRYKPFLMSKPNYAKHIEKLKSGMKLRHFLLLSLQKDLIKLISDIF